MICQECCLRDAEPGSLECFHCRVASVAFTFTGGGGYGRKNFAARTTEEFKNEFVPEGAEPVERGVWS